MDMRQAGLRTKRHRRCIRPLPWRGLCPCLSWFASMFFLRCCGCSVFLYMHLTPLSKPLYGRISPLVIHFFHKACSICVADGVRNCKYPERYLPYMLLCSPGIWQEYYCECDEELGADFECHKTLSYKGKFGGISSEFKIQPFKIVALLLRIFILKPSGAQIIPHWIHRFNEDYFLYQAIFFTT